MLFFRNKKIKTKKGFSLIEMLIVLGIFSLVIMSFYRIFSAGTQLIVDSKRKLAATNLAIERIEIIRSLDYSLIGTDGGVPDGDLVSDEYVEVGAYNFHVYTDIIYVDDSDDGTEAGGTDDEPNDYKNVNIRVYWGAETERDKVELSSNFSPDGTEAAITGGTLRLSVIDIDGMPVTGADVLIVNSATTPTVNISTQTDVVGAVLLPSAPVADQSYEISVSKTNYESANTLSPYPTTAYYPTDVHASVVEDMITESVIVVSGLSDLDMQFQDPYGTSIGEVDFDLEGGRVMGINTDTSILYNFSESLTSDVDGLESLSDISPGTYVVTLNEPGYTLWKNNSGTGNESNETILPQSVTLAEDIILLDDSFDSYFVRVIDLATGNPIEGASVELSNDALVYSETILTDQYGYAFFPGDELVPLVNGETYDVDVSHIDYTDESSTVIVNALTEETINMSL
ncbi:prepilin-type N-terminal cleavage/methylation domain-containing protein [Patescibacteria group bacterium]